MKRALILGVAVMALAATTACKKDYTCTCTTTDSSGFIDDVTVSTTISNAKKKDAEAACNASDVSLGTLSTTCTLD